MPYFPPNSSSEDTTKADKVSGATDGNLAALDSSGNLTDSGSEAADFATASDLTTHTANTSNPHSVTAAQTGAYDTSDVDALLAAKANSSHTHTLSNITDAGSAASKDVGVASGNVPLLDGSGKLSTSILPALAITDTFVV